MTQELGFSDLYDVEEESLFARDLDGQLIRDRKATLDEYDRSVDVTFVVDPDNLVTVQVPKAVPATDSQGVYLRDKDGRTIPRSTTIYDALVRGRENEGTAEELKGWDAIPTLCHQEHMNPVGVCRVCSVFVERWLRDGTIRRARRLVPSCQHRAESGMIVHTGDSRTQYGERVRTSVRMLTQLLVARNCHPEPEQRRAVSQSKTPPAGTYHNELLALAEKVHATQTSDVIKSATRDPSRIDDSSDVILLDHNNCILCNRCVRACGDVQPFNIIGRTGKGLNAAIGFDLNDPMGDSGCVACGECMISCPTGALTFKKPVTRKYWTEEKEKPDAESVPAEELCSIELFRHIPFSFLKWNDGAVHRRVLHDGQILCREGDYGATAYVIEAGKLDILVDGKYETTRTPDDIIVGEMACMNHQPRTATVRAWRRTQVLEIRRNLLYMLQRNYHARQILNRVYSERAVELHWARGEVFDTLTEQQGRLIAVLIRENVELMHVDPGMTICREGELADELYIIRVGHVKVYRGEPSGTVVLDYLDAGSNFGEIAVLSKLFSTEDVLGRRTSSCEALDHVELVRIQGEDLRRVLCEQSVRELVQERIQRIRQAFEQKCLDTLERVEAEMQDRTHQTTGQLDSVRQQLLDRGQIAFVTALIGSENVTSLRLGAGERICEKGDEVRNLYIVRSGRVVVHGTQNGEPILLNSLDSGSHLGEIAFLSTISEAVRSALPADIVPGECAASWTAKDDVELLCIPSDELRKLFLEDKHIYDSLGQRIREIRKSLEEACARMLDLNRNRMGQYIHPLNDFVDQGIHQGQMLLVLDLESCTRCDECTKACVDSHADGQSRLVRDGLRIENFLVATACRSCHDPVCLIGCPVDAIHRAPGKDELAIIIEDHCIGCGLCAHHCPFGNIHMAAPDPYGWRKARLAVTCDLCESVPGHPGPMCVHACPHEAALRMDAHEFRKIAYGN